VVDQAERGLRIALYQHLAQRLGQPHALPRRCDQRTRPVVPGALVCLRILNPRIRILIIQYLGLIRAVPQTTSVLCHSTPGVLPHSSPGVFSDSTPGVLPHNRPSVLCHSTLGVLSHNRPGVLCHSTP